MAYRLLKDRREAIREWKRRNPDKVQKQQERYRKKIGKKVLAKRLRDWKKKNPERVKLYRKRYAKAKKYKR